MSKISKEKAIKDFMNLAVKENYKIIGKYINCNSKVDVICPNGHEWSITPSHFKNGVRCPICQNLSPKKAKETFYNLLKTENYECLGEYIKNKTKVTLKCPNGHVYDVRPNDFMTGHRCRACWIENSIGKNLLGHNKNRAEKMKYKSFMQLQEIAEKRGFEILEEYININTKISMKCPNGHIRKYNIGHFKDGFGCPVCNGTDLEEAKKDFIKLADEEGYIILGKYINTMTKIKMKCPKGHIYNITPMSFKQGYRCNSCYTSSYGEETAVKVLEKYKIEFETQKTFPNLLGKNKRRLRFDFYIPKFNIAIEIQGEQHFEGSKYFNTETVEEYDNIKREYCQKNNIKLYTIDYFSMRLGLKKATENVKNIVHLIMSELI